MFHQNKLLCRCTSPGLFQCDSTKLVFGMTQEAELQYRTIQWDESLLQSAGKMAGGMLFKFESSEKAAVCQLHFPHCETKDALADVDDLLSVVHITDDGMSILKPLEITDTHVVVKVSHLSAYGLVWDAVKRLLNMTINGQILLFLRPPKRKRQVLDVFLLQENIPVSEVALQQGDAEYVKITSECHLSLGESYSVRCDPEGFGIQPGSVKFRSKYGPNFHPTFEVFLTTIPEELTLLVQDQEKTEVFKRDVSLEDQSKHPQKILSSKNSDPEKILMSVRTNFVESLSEPSLNKLLDFLHESEIINDDEIESVKSQKYKAEKARHVIDMVRNKGSEASSVLIAALFEVDPYLSTNLRLPSPGPAHRLRSRKGRSYRSVMHQPLGFVVAAGLALVAAILAFWSQK
ncbi:Caspase-1 [Collichthys lucidus]|uniref:Caspase-1 n=1 Tax=Collichthys lucidus TaxID=240159 RepID=A0A4U5V4D9_COLLU|nr:Caspase-1 [Collichthys lucidus]